MPWDRPNKDRSHGCCAAQGPEAEPTRFTELPVEPASKLDQHQRNTVKCQNVSLEQSKARLQASTTKLRQSGNRLENEEHPEAFWQHARRELPRIGLFNQRILDEHADGATSYRF